MVKKGYIVCYIVLIGLLMGIFVLDTAVVDAKSMSDKQIVKEYCRHNYQGYKIKYFTKWNDNVMSHRANKKVVYVQIEKSVSSGKKDMRNGMYWGYIKGQHYYKTWYNKKVKKGKVVKSYYIYNPKNNYDDDVVAVVDNKILR